MKSAEFLQSVWPEQGVYAIATPYKIPNSQITTYSHKVFETIAEADAFISKYRGSRDIFFCVHSLREAKVWNPEKLDRRTNEKGAFEIRTQKNMLAAKCFFLDLDVGSDPQKYASPADAIDALKAFCKTAHLPKPMLLSSGGGVHVYWTLSESIPSTEWRHYASQLKQLTTLCGLRADPSRTSDAASVLRVAGTLNFKDMDNLRKVRVLQETTPVSIDLFKQRLSDALIRAGEMPEAHVPLGPRIPSDDDLGSNTSRTYDGPPVTIKALGKACGQVRRFAKLRGNVSEPEWYTMLQLIRHTEDGPAWCHKLSTGHPSYSYEMTEQKLDYLTSKDVGPSYCSTIAEKCGSEICAACPHKNSVTTPMVAGRFKDEAEPPVVTSLLPTVIDIELPPPPHPFKRLKSGGIGIEITNKDGDEVTVVIYENDLYPLRRIVDHERQLEQQMWRAHLPRGVVQDFVLDASALYKLDVLATHLANKGVYIRPSRIREVQEYMSAYITELQKLADANDSYSTLGWHNDYQTFVLPDKQLHRDGSVRAAHMTTHAESSSQAITKKGTLEEQVKLLSFYNHPDYIPHQFFILAALAAPLFHMTGHAGVVVNATGEAGSSKSTAIYTGSGLWAHPTKYPLNGTNHGATQRARAQRMTTMGSLPVCVDEITTMSHKDAQELVMSITQPEGRIGLGRDGKEKRHADGERSTIMLCTANNSLHSLLSHENSAGTAGSMRVFEIKMSPGRVHAKHEADEYLRHLKNHYGHIGEVMVSHIVTNYETVERRVHAVMAEIDKIANIQSAERFWSAIVAAVHVGGEIGHELGLTQYNASALRHWALTHQLPHMRGVVTSEYNTPIGTLADYLETISANILVSNRNNDNSPMYVLRAPSGQMLGHYDMQGKALWLLKKGFKDYCARVGASYVGIIDDLSTPTLIGRDLLPVVNVTSVRHTLGAGTEFAKIQSRCFALDMSHPEVTGAAIIAVVEGSKQSAAPAGGKIRSVQ